MTASDSLPPIDDELLSAYLDDELSEQQRTEVERRLSADADARRLLEELRTLGATLQTLPLERPDAELRQKIKARIDQALPTLATTANDPRASGLRRWSWAAMAIAAALMLALVLPDEEAAEVAGVDQRQRRVADPPPVAEAEDAPQLFADDDSARRESGPAPLGSGSGVERAAPAGRDSGDDAPEPAGEAESRLALGATPSAATPLAAPSDPGFAADQPAARQLPVVELTPTSRREPFADFRRVLAANQVELREAVAQPPAGESLQQAFQYRVAEADASSAGEAVLIEATPRQIERILLDCYLDRDAYAAVEVQEHAIGRVGGRYAFSREIPWERYTRGKQETFGEGFDLADAAEASRRQRDADDELLLEKNRLEKNRSDQPLAETLDGAAAKSAPPQQGWAMRLRPGSTAPAAASEAALAYAAQSSTAAPADSDQADQRVQVLFLLQAPEPR